MKFCLSTLILLNLSISNTAIANDQACEKWFKGGKLVAGNTNCELNCAILPVDMGTFDCPSKCDSLCRVLTKKSNSTFAYPKGMTKGDHRMVAKYPKDALKVYEAKQKADDLTIKIFKKPGRNDESDAFRHFVWAALITKDLGSDKAREFLNAHEEEAGQPSAEKDMDIANNKAGTDFVVNKTKTGSGLEIDEIEREGLARIKSGRLKILNPSDKKMPDGYYSK